MYEQMVELSFQLEIHPVQQIFRSLKMVKFEGILGMDWLIRTKVDINFNHDIISFHNSSGEKVQF